MASKASYKLERKKILEALRNTEAGTKEYRELLIMLHSLEESNKTRCERKVSGDTVVKSGVSLVTTMGLILFERNNPLTTKLLSMIPKVRL